MTPDRQNDDEDRQPAHRDDDASHDDAPRDREATDGHDPEKKPDQPPPPPRRRVALYVAIPFAVLVAFGIYEHWRQDSAAADTLHTAQQEQPTVEVAKAKRTTDLAATALPGQTLAFTSADLFARATGYIAERRVDIGSRVKKGDLLLRIAAPDLDQQLAQARATLGQMQAQLSEAQASLEQAQANSKLAKVNSARTQILAGEGWATTQSRDTQNTTFDVSTHTVRSAQAGIGVAVADVRAQQATVDRLVALTGFERVVAPFDGVITQRDVDVGALVQSDSNTGTALLHIDQDDVLRCEVYVPQSEFVGIHDGLPAHVSVPELPNHVFKATVSRASTALAQNSRSMLVEVDIDNADHLLTSGLFVTVSFDVKRPDPMVVVPDAALIFDQAGLRVAVVGSDDKVSMKPVVIGRDTGTEADLARGLQGDEQVVVNPPTDLAEGQTVKVQQPGKTDDKSAS